MEYNPSAPVALPKTVLVVDDSNIMRRLVSEIVGMDPDFQVIDTAENGKVALQKVRKLKPDVILLDIEMPELSGLETLRRLGLRSPSKVVILSSLGGEGTPERAEALRLGAAEVLDKPSGSVSMDIKSSRGSAVMRALRRVTGLPLHESDEEAASADVAIEQPSAETVLRAAAFGMLLDSVKTAVLAFDSSGVLTYSNNLARKFLERPTIEVGKATIEELFGDYNSMFADEIRAVMGSGEAKTDFVVDYSTEGGDWLPLLASVTPAPPKLKDFAHVVVNIQDTSAEQNLRKVLDKVMSRAVTEAVVGGEELALGGKTAQATVLFSDVRSFTKLCEGLGAEAVVHMMNEYFAFMADVIRGNYGVIDKYIGDAIMALFGVPKSTGNDAQNAVQAGFAMLQALDLLNGDREKDGRTPFRVGIGLATGQVVAGLLGSPERMNYTVMGNSVNLSARIESLTSHYGAQLLVCSETYHSLKNPYHSRLIDKIRVKGQSKPAALYEILYGQTPEKEEQWLESYQNGLSVYEGGQFKEALALFKEALNFNPNDKASKVLLSRCEILMERPQPDWDGVWSMESKSG